MGINRVVISGNLTRDAELRSTQSGYTVLGFGVAVNDRRRNQQTGEWEDYPNFIDCTLFGQRGQALEPYLKKGTKVAIEGKLRQSQWERDGQKRSKIEVIVDEIELMSRSNGAGQGAAMQGGYGSQPAMGQGGYGANYGGYQPIAPQADPMAVSAPAVMPPVDPSSSVYDDDIPF